MPRAREVFVQVVELAELAVTEYTFVRVAVPRTARSYVFLVDLDATCNHARGIGDDIVGVLLADEMVDLAFAHSRGTAA